MDQRREEMGGKGYHYYYIFIVIILIGELKVYNYILCSLGSYVSEPYNPHSITYKCKPLSFFFCFAGWSAVG